MITLLALFGLAFAEPAPADPVEDPGAAPLTEATTADLLAEARKRLLRGDYEGVRIVAEQVLAREESRDARYLIASAWEHDGHPEIALPLYDALLAADPSDVDARFRRAETLGRLGRYAEARAELDALGDAWQGADRVQIEILDALFDLGDGGSPKKPLKALAAALDAATPEQAPAYQARARAHLVAMAVHDADEIAFVGRKGKKGRRLEARAGLVALATEQTLAIIKLQAPEPILDSLLLIGHAHESFGQAMLDESDVKLTDDQRRIYEAERARRVETLWIKAARYYENALEYAGTVGWEGAPVGDLRAAHADVVARIERLASP